MITAPYGTTVFDIFPHNSSDLWTGKIKALELITTRVIHYSWPMVSLWVRIYRRMIGLDLEFESALCETRSMCHSMSWVLSCSSPFSFHHNGSRKCTREREYLFPVEVIKINTVQIDVQIKVSLIGIDHRRVHHGIVIVFQGW